MMTPSLYLLHAVSLSLALPHWQFVFILSSQTFGLAYQHGLLRKA